MDLPLLYVSHQPFVLGGVDPNAIAREHELLFEIPVAGANLGRHGNNMADRPVVDAAILAVPAVPGREEPRDFASEDFVALIHLAIHHVHMAVAGRVARSEFDEESVTRSVFV